MPKLLTWLNSDSTQNTILITRLNSDSTHLSQSWVKSDSRLIKFYLIWQKVIDRGGGGVRSNAALGRFILCKASDKCKILRFSLKKSATQLWLKQYPVDSTLTQMTISVIRLWPDSCLWFSRPTQLWLDSFESESSQIWLTTHESSTTLHTSDRMHDMIQTEARFLPCDYFSVTPVFRTESMYRDVHKKLTHLFYNFHGTKRCQDEFADTKR